MEEGREGVRTKGLQKSNLVITHKPYTNNGRPGVCEFACAHLVFTKLWGRMLYGYNKVKLLFFKRDNIFGRYRTPKR